MRQRIDISYAMTHSRPHRKPNPQETAMDSKQATDSAFGCLLRSISRSQAVIDAATVYRASCGRRRVYLSASAADAYDRGFSNWPTVPALLKGPEADGYFDREQQASDIDEARREAAEEREQQR